MTLGSTASARTAVYDGDIEEGEVYQLNNYIIEITDIFPEAGTASYYVYERDKKITTGLLDVNESFEFDFEDEGKVQMRLKSVHTGGVLPRATVEITMSNYKIGDLYINEVVEGGRSQAAFAGDPKLVITKSVDKSEIEVGDLITVTVNAKTTGNDAAHDVLFTDPKQEHFVLKETTYEISTTIPKIDYGQSMPETLVYIYKLKATEAGTFDLRAVTATYRNSASQTYQSSSNTPTVTVLEGNKLRADVETTMVMDLLSVRRNEKVTSTIILRNTGSAPAQAVRLDIMVPDGMEYVSGDEGIETVGGKPRIYIETLQPNNDKEFTCTLKAKDVGTYSINSELSYEYSNGVDAQKVKQNGKFATSNINVKEGKFDFMLKNPLYIIIPVAILAVIGVHIYRRHRQYRY
ncbi:BatD family protein [Methanosarcina horonobensis]|uniref:BatD family protein n=1 Tax=Methanosarcina horonobensis TaxID=418008 RepID=UPI00138DFD12|nr:BatD family protein [Methanosarcina horonobensis]